MPRPFKNPPPQKRWNELLYPQEWPLCTHEMSFLLPHFLKEGRGRIEAYFTRVFNPVWTYPDGFSWIEMLRDEEKVGLHAALTPTWSETAWFADYVLPMGFSSERHDLMSQESYAGKWIGFRQPVTARAAGKGREEIRVHLSGESGRSLGRGRILDQPLVGDRSRWFDGHSAMVRIAVPSGREAYGRRILRLDFRKLRSGIARNRRKRRARRRWNTCASTAHTK